MSSLDDKLIMFGEWSPDSVEFDNPDLELARNVLPVYGAHRVMEEAQVVASVASSYPITGGYSHLASEAAPNQRAVPETAPTEYTDTDQTDWYDQDGNDLHGGDPVVEEGALLIGTFEPDDTTFVFTVDDDFLGSQGNWKVWALEQPRIKPASSVDPRIKLRVKFKAPGPAGAMDVRVWLFDDGGDIVGDEVSGGSSVTITGPTNADEWTEIEHDLSAGEITALDAADWSKLHLGIACLPKTYLSDIGYSVPTEDVHVGDWRRDDATTTDLYTELTIPVPALTDWQNYIETDVPAGGEHTYICNMGTLPNLWGDILDLKTRFLASASKASTSFKYELIQLDTTGEPDEEAEGKLVTYGGADYRIIYTWREDEVSTDQAGSDLGTVTAETVSNADLDEPNFADDFYMAITASYAGASGSNEVSAQPTGPDPVVGGASGNGSDTATDDSNGVTYSGSGARGATFEFGNLTPATEANPRNITVKATAGMTFNLQMRGSNAAGQRRVIAGYPSVTVPSSGELVVDCRNGNLAAHDDVTLFLQSSDAGTVTYISYDYIGDASNARLYSVGFDKEELPAGLAISHAYLDVETDVDFNRPDRNLIFAGDKEKLYTVDESGFVDVSKAGSPAYGDESNDTPRIWDFCSWGDDIVATNFADPIQRISSPYTTFADIYDVASPETPQARFCAVVGGQLILADIEPDSVSSSDGKPYHVWPSFVLDPTQWDLADYDNQSALFPLIAQTGGITGLVGGEYGVVFKRQSIWRMSYVGLPAVLGFDTISIGQGTPFPQSIVQVDQDIYFWGNGGIFRVLGGSQIQRISGGRIEKLIFDDEYEDYALQADYVADSVINESQVQGAYDAYTGLVFWLYKGPAFDEGSGLVTPQDHRLRYMVVYNPREDRWTHCRIPGLNGSILLGRTNVSYREATILRGLLMMAYDGTDLSMVKFRGEQSYNARLQTKIMSAQAFDYRSGREIEVLGVRPIFASQPNTQPPNFALTIEASQDPSMFRNLQTRTVDHTNVDTDGFIHLAKPTLGEFYRFTVDIPQLTDVNVKEFVGVQAKIKARGEY